MLNGAAGGFADGLGGKSDDVLISSNRLNSGWRLIGCTAGLCDYLLGLKQGPSPARWHYPFNTDRIPSLRHTKEEMLLSK